MKIFNPESFQGSLNRLNYFEGWYCKHVSDDGKNVYAFIPGVSLNKNDPHAFIQVINGVSGETNYCTYPISQFSASADTFDVVIGSSHFSKEGITLAIDQKDFSVAGKITYDGITPYPKSLLSPGIMGWFSYIPFMECRHGVVSINHTCAGTIEINNTLIDLNNATGYIEKDWGRSFPEAWIWLQCNNFSRKGTSVMFSIAKIPWFGRYFMGFLGFVYCNNTIYSFATYNNSKVTSITRAEQTLTIVIEDRTSVLTLKVTTKGSGVLIAPISGSMTRRIKESIDSDVEVVLKTKKGKTILDAKGTHAGVEVVDSIFDLLRAQGIA
jgi:tocopherol cyclase